MNKEVPKPSKLLSEKWDKYNFDFHRRTLSITKPVMNISEPISLTTYPKNNMKKL
jgi:hypothetical protein